MNVIKIDPERQLAPLDRNVFGGFAEHLGRCIYGGIYDEGSPLSDANGLRLDALEALRRLNMPIMRYPGGNFVSGYRWMDGIGPRDERPARAELAWRTVESNRFGTDDFVDFCRALNTEPYMVVNCGDGSLREARDWVEYCNGTTETALVKMRRANGHEAPHNVKYWGIGNEVDGPWQMGMKTPTEYARAVTEFGKLMKMVDPSISIVAAWTSGWFEDWVERGQLLIEQAGNLIDYMAIHWYVGNREDDYYRYMSLSELLEERLGAAEGMLAALQTCYKPSKPIRLAVDEWNVWYRTRGDQQLEEVYNLEDALVVALQLNAFIRHARSVKMANLAQIVNVIAPIVTRPDGLLLQSIYYPFQLYSEHAGAVALDVAWEGDTFEGGDHTGLRVLDVSATLAGDGESIAVFVVNRSLDTPAETRIRLQEGAFTGKATATVVNGDGTKAVNTFDEPNRVGVKTLNLTPDTREITLALEPHSVTVVKLGIR